jgi:hypothetical protein
VSVYPEHGQNHPLFQRQEIRRQEIQGSLRAKESGKGQSAGQTGGEEISQASNVQASNVQPTNVQAKILKDKTMDGGGSS